MEGEITIAAAPSMFLRQRGGRGCRVYLQRQPNLGLLCKFLYVNGAFSTQLLRVFGLLFVSLVLQAHEATCVISISFINFFITFVDKEFYFIFK